MIAPLEQATALLDGDLKIAVYSVRAAAWITRSALEAIVRDLLQAKGYEPGSANTTSILICLEMLYQAEPDVAMSAQYAWDSLSRASHHHAYELEPTHAEVAALIQTVQRLGETPSTAANPTTNQ